MSRIARLTLSPGATVMTLERTPFTGSEGARSPKREIAPTTSRSERIPVIALPLFTTIWSAAVLIVTDGSIVKTLLPFWFKMLCIVMMFPPALCGFLLDGFVAHRVRTPRTSVRRSTDTEGPRRWRDDQGNQRRDPRAARCRALIQQSAKSQGDRRLH